MEVSNSNAVGGSLQISTDVLAKIARLATLEVDGVHAVSLGAAGVKGLFPKNNTLQPPIEVALADDVAEITVNLQPDYGCKIPALSAKVQENVKNAIQNMTGITVSKVNIIVTGVAVPKETPDQTE